MAQRPKRVNYSEHEVSYDSANRRFVIKPRRVHATATPAFGLGNALIRINLAYIPEKIVKPITGETTGSGIIPPDGKKLTEWKVYPSGLSDRSTTVTGFNGDQVTITYPEAAKTESIAAKIDSDIGASGAAVVHAQKSSRIEW